MEIAQLDMSDQYVYQRTSDHPVVLSELNILSVIKTHK